MVSSEKGNRSKRGTVPPCPSCGGNLSYRDALDVEKASDKELERIAERYGLNPGKYRK